MTDFVFGEGKIWLNAASEGPLPKIASEALQDAIRWKSRPFQLTNEKFISVPLDLKESIGRLIGVSGRDVVLGNSASYGLHILANGIPWQKGDEILLMQNDFPANILPWLLLQQKGVKVIQISPKDKILTPEELEKNITKKTRLFCVSHVHTFSGFTLDIKKFGQICHDQGIIFVLNISQSAGTMPIDVSKLQVDAVVSAGYKWLCGPYGTGFCWMKPSLRQSLELNQAYWIAMCSSQDLESEGPLELRDIKTARKYDVFGTANFFNFVPFKAAINYWLKMGLENVRNCHAALIDRLILQLQNTPYEFISPKEGFARSSLVVISHRQKEKNLKIFEELKSQGIFTALWKGNLRISAHVYNTLKDIDQLAMVLKKF